MADINGTPNNDAIQPYGSSLLITLSGTIGDGILPIANVRINGALVVSNLAVTANHDAGATQTIALQIPSGTAVTSVALEYTNDAQTVFDGDRNMYVSSVILNGTVLPTSSASYLRTADGSVIVGQDDMKWGGSLTFTGPLVTGATARTSGNVSVDGLAGIDTVLFGGAKASYNVSGSSVTALAGGDTVSISNVERLQFSDINFALDMSGHAGTTAKLITALFGQSYLGVEQYVGLGISLLDAGVSETALASLAIGTPLFTQLAGSTSNTAFVQTVYQNVIGSAPSASDLNYYVGLLDSGAYSKASLAVLAAESSYNAVHIVGVAGGIEYI